MEWTRPVRWPAEGYGASIGPPDGSPKNMMPKVTPAAPVYAPEPGTAACPGLLRIHMDGHPNAAVQGREHLHQTV